MTFVKNVRTPTLLLQGEDDTTDPIGQSQQFYRGLKRYNVETDLVLYPREPHGTARGKAPRRPSEPCHRVVREIS